MKNRDIIVTLLLLILLCSIPKARAESLSVAAYQQQLQGIVAKVESLESQPENAGTPEIASDAHRMVQKVTGILERRPPMRRISCSPPSAWITLPAPKNRRALKKA